MFKGTVRILSLLMSLVLLLTVGGVYAAWKYGMPPAPHETEIPVKLSNFYYADIYILKIEPAASGLTKTDHTKVQAEVTGSTSFQVTFYNDSDIIYYYNKEETNLDPAKYDIENITQGESVYPKTPKTITVRFYDSVSDDIFFHFVVDPDDVETVVARTAVDHFRDVLNNVAFDTSYETLDTAMDNRSGMNKASAVTYIGNVSGSNSGDSATINTLFGDEFMSMDLDGDGDTEPITMMIKRENLDNREATGCTYTYTNYNRQYTVNGAEMTLYITAQDLSSVSSGAEISVYAAVFTKYPGETEWVELVPLTKGVADANNYNGSFWGDANSFNTDTWVSDGGQTLRQIIAAQN